MTAKIVFLGLLALLLLLGKKLDEVMSRPFLAKLKAHPAAGPREVSVLWQRIQKINIIRYFLRLCIFLYAAFMLFGQPRLSWIVLFALLILTSILDTNWRRLIRDGIKKLSSIDR